MAVVGRTGDFASQNALVLRILQYTLMKQNPSKGT